MMWLKEVNAQNGNLDQLAASLINWPDLPMIGYLTSHPNCA